MSQHFLSSSLRLALPCYENRVMPRFGIARTFVFADVRSQTRQIVQIAEQTWEPDKELDLPTWLHLNHVDGILCGGIHPRFQIALETAGMWVIWGFRGEIDNVLNQWLNSDNLETISKENYGFVSCCRLQKTSKPGSFFKSTCQRRTKS
jgi:predicted Fe-Mo cluster-binding NifX family protein